jgi:hypothetical protein
VDGHRRKCDGRGSEVLSEKNGFVVCVDSMLLKVLSSMIVS